MLLQNMVDVLHHFHVVMHDRRIGFDRVIAVVDDVDQFTAHPLFKLVNAIIRFLLPPR